MAEHHIVERDEKTFHLLHLSKRVLPHNVGEVAGFPAEVADEILKQGGGVYAARVLMKKTAPHWDANHNPPLKVGTLQALPPGYAKQLIADGIAEYVTPEIEAKAVAKAQAADAEHAERMTQTVRMGISNAQSAAQKR